jgi:acetyltransferase-like isoleucine patch superfamily enzyme
MVIGEIRNKKKEIQMIFKLTRPIWILINYLYFKLQKIQYTKLPTINGVPYICNKGVIRIGVSVTINSCMMANPIGGDRQTILFAAKGAQIIIGNNVGMSNCTICSDASIIIEDDVMIGGAVKIYDTDFHSLQFVERMNKNNDPGIKSKAILIKKGAFIGAHSIILKGITIGQMAIIGSGSVVSRDIPDNQIWAGNPAVFIREIPS